MKGIRILGILGAAHWLALAATLIGCPLPNTTGFRRWMVKVQPASARLAPPLSNTTGGNRWRVKAQPTPAGLAQPLNTTGGNRQPQTDTQTKPEQPRPIKRVSPIDTIRKHMHLLGYSIDESKSKPDVIVSNYSDTKKGKVTLAMVYDKRKEVVGFYIYNFGNVDKAVDAAALNKYLLSANDAIVIGGFFVDKEGDIGYKYVSSASQLTQGSFEVIYVTMVAVALDRRPAIRKLIETGKLEDAGKDSQS